MKAIKALLAAFFTDAHAQAIKNLADTNADGKVDLKDVQAEYDKVKADLSARQASYWHALGVASVTFAGGVYVGHKFWS